VPTPPAGGRDLAAQLDRVRLESDTLYAVIGVVASSPDLRRVLDGVVALLTEATACHACFVYLREGDRLRLSAASSVFAHLVGRLEFGVDEGLAGWVVRHRRPEYIRDNALADPRMKYIPEIQEERFQSMVAIPVSARSGEVIGVVVLHTQAPREFDEPSLNFLVHTASLMAGAIENAKLYEDTRRRADALAALSALAQEIAAVTGREELHRVVTAGVRALLECELCQLYAGGGDAGGFDLVARDPADSASPWPAAEGAAVLIDALRRRPSAGGGGARGTGGDAAASLLAAPVAAGSEQLGILAAVRRAPFSDVDDELLRAVAHQLAVALKKAELIERLTAENIVRDVFAALSAGSLDVAEARARAAGADLTRLHVVVDAEPLHGLDGERPWPALAARVEERLRRIAPGALCDAGRERLQALVPLAPGARDGELRALHAALDELGRGERVLIGVSERRAGVTEGERSVREAADAAQIAQSLLPAGGALAYGDLGAYKYLVRLPSGAAPVDGHSEALQRLVDYDRRRRAQLLETLEQYLRERRSIAQTARALYIHPNTLRQRLERIEKLSGLDLAGEDLLSLELALKLIRLAPPA
jgi:GAF domain-containing protein